MSPEVLSGGEDGGDGDRGFRSRGGGGGIGLAGAGKLTIESGDFDLKLLGLKLNKIEGLLDNEGDGETEFDDGYEVVLELELRLPRFSASTAGNSLR